MVEKSKKDKDKEKKKKLKQKLKELSKKYLKNRKKRTKDPKLYKQIQQDINRKVDTAQSMPDISKLMSLFNRPLPRSPVEIGTIGQRLSKMGEKVSKVEKDIKSSTVKENYTKLKEQLSNVKDKYNNNTMSWDDIDNIYSSGKRFGQSIQTDIQTVMGMKGMYDSTKEGAKKAYDYLTRLLNRNRPSGTNAFNPSGEQTPTPPPSSSPPPPPTPPPTQEPRVFQPREQTEDTESYLKRGLNLITNPIVGAGLLGVGANYLMGRQRINQLREEGRDMREEANLSLQRMRNREAYNSFRDTSVFKDLQRQTGLQDQVENDMKIVGFREGSVAPSKEMIENIRGRVQQGSLEKRMDRLGRTEEEQRQFEAEQDRYNEEMTQQQLAERQEQQEPQME